MMGHQAPNHAAASASMIIDGRMGEGGGQVLRSSLTLSLCTGRALRVENIRARRRRPGLMRQHLACVRAALEISSGHAVGTELGSTELCFTPGPVRAGDYRFAVGSAGSAALVLQTVLMPLLLADAVSTVRIEGGTHNAWAPPFDFLEHSFLPQLARMGGRVDLELEHIGFYPAGGGVIVATIYPISRSESGAKEYELLHRGEVGRHSAVIRCAHLPPEVADREWQAMAKRLHWASAQKTVCNHTESVGPGNSVHAVLPFENVTEVVSSFGARNRSAKHVGDLAAKEVCRYLNSTAPVGKHLADQLLLPLVLLAGGKFRTLKPSRHLITNVELVNHFFPAKITVEELQEESWLVSVGSPT